MDLTLLLCAHHYMYFKKAFNKLVEKQCVMMTVTLIGKILKANKNTQASMAVRFSMCTSSIIVLAGTHKKFACSVMTG